ncbi:hypothetical protein TWF281_003993 [Arthrobotrys megalospora]
MNQYERKLNLSDARKKATWERYLSNGRSLLKEQAAFDACQSVDFDLSGDPEIDLMSVIGWKQLEKELAEREEVSDEEKAADGEEEQERVRRAHEEKEAQKQAKKQEKRQRYKKNLQRRKAYNKPSQHT